MNARRFHLTLTGEKVLACIGTSEHVALIVKKDPGRRKFLLRFHLAGGDAKEAWRSAARCEPADRDCAMGPTRSHQKYKESLL